MARAKVATLCCALSPFSGGSVAGGTSTISTSSQSQLFGADAFETVQVDFDRLEGHRQIEWRSGCRIVQYGEHLLPS
jgi:hypothetical protein